MKNAKHDCTKFGYRMVLINTRIEPKGVMVYKVCCRDCGSVKINDDIC